VIVNPLRITDSARNEFESSLVICFSGRSRDATVIIEQQAAGIVDHSAGTIAALDRLKADGIEMKNALLAGNIQAMERILDASWKRKKMTDNRPDRTALRCHLCQWRARGKGLRRRRRWFRDVRPSRGSPGAA